MLNQARGLPCAGRAYLVNRKPIEPPSGSPRNGCRIIRHGCNISRMAIRHEIRVVWLVDATLRSRIDHNQSVCRPTTHPWTFIRQSVAEARRADLLDLVERMGASHPAEPHWFLPLIGVDPRWQGKGRGSALLQHMLTRCDREQQLAYLDSTNPRNIPRYERHGFEQVGIIESGSCPPVYPMLRKPR